MKTDNQNDIQDFIRSLPPSSQNNARAIVGRKVDAFYRSKSEWRAQELEDITGIPVDFTDGDVCAEARGEQVS